MDVVTKGGSDREKMRPQDQAQGFPALVRQWAEGQQRSLKRKKAVRWEEKPREDNS